MYTFSLKLCFNLLFSFAVEFCRNKVLYLKFFIQLLGDTRSWTDLMRLSARAFSLLSLGGSDIRRLKVGDSKKNHSIFMGY